MSHKSSYFSLIQFHKFENSKTTKDKLDKEYFEMLWGIVCINKSNVQSAEIDWVNQLKSLLSNSNFSEVLILQISVDFSFFGVLSVLELELSDVWFSVLISLLDELSEIINFL